MNCVWSIYCFCFRCNDWCCLERLLFIFWHLILIDGIFWHFHFDVAVCFVYHGIVLAPVFNFDFSPFGGSFWFSLFLDIIIWVLKWIWVMWWNFLNWKFGCLQFGGYLWNYLCVIFGNLEKNSEVNDRKKNLHSHDQ